MEQDFIQLRSEFDAHIKEAAVQIVKANEEVKSMHDKLDNLAKADEEIMEFMKRVNMGIGFFRFSWNNASKIGSFVLMLVGFYALIKYGFLGAVAYLFKLTSGNV